MKNHFLTDFFLKFYSKIAVIFVVIVVSIAHIVATITIPELYNWQARTISDLASQQYAYSWIMSLGLLGFGLILFLGSIFKIIKDKKNWYREVPILLCTISIFITGLFDTKPLTSLANFHNSEDTIHAVFATIAGFSLAFAMIVAFFPLGRLSKKQTTNNFIILSLLTFVSIIYGLADEFSPSLVGITQRLLWLVGIYWIMFYYNNNSHFVD